VLPRTLPPATFAPAGGTPLDVLGFYYTPFERAEPILTGAAGLVAAWALWQRRRAAPEYYAAWAVIILASSVHLSMGATSRLLSLIGALYPEFGIPTQLSPSALLWNFVLNAGLLALGYWQLVRQRPQAAEPAQSATEPPQEP
jgi:hypothetical protein